MKKLLGYLLGIPLLVALLALLVPSLYGMAWMLALVLPPFCLWATVSDAWRGEDPAAREDLAWKLALALLVVPVAMLAFATPLRAVLLGVLGFFPVAMARFDEIHGFVYEPLRAAFGDLAPYWLDVYWGALGALVIFLIAFCGSVLRNRLVRQVQILPTARIRSVAVGLAELKGKAITLAGRAKGDPIMRSWIESTGDGHASRTHAEPFYVDDGTGRMLVDPRGTGINHDGSFFGIGLHQAILRRIDGNAGFAESRLTPGDPVYVVGNVQINHDRDAYPDDEVVLKPSRSSWMSMRFNDLFFVSNLGEKAVLKGLRGSVGRGWRNVLIGMAFCAWLSAYGLANIMQFTSGSVDGAPRWLRAIMTPTTLEREIRVPGLGVHPTFELLRMIEEGDREKTDAIMDTFRDLGLGHLAVPTLTGQATTIDSRGFGVANYWLGRVGESPPGHWGAQLYGDERMTRKEVLVTRIATRYHDRRLFVSYRAFAGRERVRANDGIRNRKVVIELVHEGTGKKHTATFPAQIGLNRADDVQAFEYLEPGRYAISIYLKTAYRSGLYDRGSRVRSAMDIVLEE